MLVWLSFRTRRLHICQPLHDIFSAEATLPCRDAESFVCGTPTPTLWDLLCNAGPIMIVYLRMTWDKFLNSSNKKCTIVYKQISSCKINYAKVQMRQIEPGVGVSFKWYSDSDSMHTAAATSEMYICLWQRSLHNFWKLSGPSKVFIKIRLVTLWRGSGLLRRPISPFPFFYNKNTHI